MQSPSQEDPLAEPGPLPHTLIWGGVDLRGEGPDRDLGPNLLPRLIPGGVSPDRWGFAGEQQIAYTPYVPLKHSAACTPEQDPFDLCPIALLQF